MPNIRPVSDLRNYTEVLREVQTDSPVFLTRNGRGCYAIMDMQEYERLQAQIKLIVHNSWQIVHHMSLRKKFLSCIIGYFREQVNIHSAFLRHFITYF